MVSITEQAEDNATGRLLEGIIESVDEYYSENLAQEVVRGMREAAFQRLLPRLERPLRLPEDQGQRRGEGAPHP